MVAVKRARGKRSFAIGDRSGFKVPYTSLKTTWDGLRVEPEDWEPKHPQLTPAKNVVDATALFDPRPDNDPNNVEFFIGYNYDQFNPSGANIKNRLMEYQDDTINVNGMTTNADISSVDSQSYIKNAWSTNLYSQQLNSQINYFGNPKNFKNYFVSASHIVAPTSVILANSTKITSGKLPRRILRGYFLINSDILDQANFYQTANPLATLAMVGKYSGANGFIQYDGGGAVFTVTRKKTLTSIKTQILDPEGGLAQIGDNSGIIYRIDKTIPTDLKFGENLLSGVYGKSPK